MVANGRWSLTRGRVAHGGSTVAVIGVLNITINQKVLKYVLNIQSKDEESLVKQAFFNVIRLTLLWQKKPLLSFNEYVRILEA